MIYKSITELIGRTPLLRLRGLEREFGLKAELLGKLEYFNPTGSVKDRPALAIIEDLEKQGKITKETLLIEPTSGNTGIGLAAVCAVRGYKLVLTMPETMSVERRKLLAAFGAKIVLTEGSKGMRGAIERAEQLHAENKDSVICGQFVNEANPEAHYRTTGPEIWKDCEGKLDIFVAGVGTGGTFSGTVKYLKEQNPKLYAVAVEPQGSAVLSGGKAGSHGLQGIGAGFVPQILDTSLIDETVPVSDEDAYEIGRTLAVSDGVFTGISAGAAVWAAIRLAQRPQNSGKRIVAIIPDTGARYLSTPGFFPEK